MEIWGKEFRPEYANLSKLRPYLPNVPFVAATATANAHQLARIKEFLCIRKDSITVHETLNRKNLFYGIKEIRGRGDGQLDLDFVVPLNKDADTYEQLIRPTIIYCDTYEDCRAVAKYLRRRMNRDMRRRPKLSERMAKTDVRAHSEVLISVYYSNLSDTMKSYIEADWRQGRTKVLVSTSAWGMGIHDTHVERVIQWKAKMVDCLNTLVQRWGRCARDPKIHGMCLFFVEKQFFGSRGAVGNIQISRFRVAERVSRKNKTQEEKRADMETGLYRLINPPTETRCRRKIILNYYGDPLRHEDSQNLVNSQAPCCDQCGIPDDLQLGWASSVFSETYVYVHPSNAQAPPAKIWHHVEPLLVERLKNTLRSLCRALFASQSDLNPKLWTQKSILTDKQIHSLATHATSIHETSDFYKIPGIKWANRIPGK